MSIILLIPYEISVTFKTYFTNINKDGPVESGANNIVLLYQLILNLSPLPPLDKSNL